MPLRDLLSRKNIGIVWFITSYADFSYSVVDVEIKLANVVINKFNTLYSSYINALCHIYIDFLNKTIQHIYVRKNVKITHYFVVISVFTPYN